LKLQKFIDSNFITMSRRDVRQQRKRAEATRGIKAPHTTKKHQVLVKKKTTPEQPKQHQAHTWEHKNYTRPIIRVLYLIPYTINDTFMNIV
jgi:hypothetical protein